MQHGKPMPGIKNRDHRPANLFPGTIVCGVTACRFPGAAAPHVVQSTPFELVIIIKTAKALAIPPGVPAMADFIHILFSPRIPQCGIAR